jgi:hypothetical protein
MKSNLLNRVTNNFINHSRQLEKLHTLTRIDEIGSHNSSEKKFRNAVLIFQ